MEKTVKGKRARRCAWVEAWRDAVADADARIRDARARLERAEALRAAAWKLRGMAAGCSGRRAGF